MRARNCSDWTLFYLWQSDDCIVAWLYIYQIESTKWTCHLFRISRTISRQSCLRHQHLSYNIISFCYFRCFPINHHRPLFAAIHFASLLHCVVYRKIIPKKDVFFIISIHMCNVYNSNARDHIIYLLVPLRRNLKCILKFVAQFAREIKLARAVTTYHVVAGLSRNITLVSRWRNCLSMLKYMHDGEKKVK